MKKKQIANLIMVLIIAVIAAGGVFGVGAIMGWFDQPADRAVLADRVGILTVERDGIAYSVASDAVLRQGDILTVSNGGRVRIVAGENYLLLNEGTTLTITDPSADSFRAVADTGEVFCMAESPVTLQFMEKTLSLENTAVLLSVRDGAQSLSVLSGKAEDISAGQKAEWIGGERTVGALSLQSLNDFSMHCIRDAKTELYFTKAQLDQFEADRLAAEQKDLEALLNATEPAVDPTAPQTAPTPATPGDGKDPVKPSVPQSSVSDPVPTVPKESVPAESRPSVPKATDPVTTEPALPKWSCTVTIRCDSILNNKASLDPAKAGFVPSSGIILRPTTVEFTEGETVFDVLKRACDTAGIQLEYNYTPGYKSYYVEGIHHLYEFDCGEQSGWMYKVNGWFPNYGCSSYVPDDGDNIVWCYTCQGLGADVGASGWE